MALFSLDPGLVVWTWITFGILFAVLAKFVVPGILKNLQDREDYIHSSVDKTAEIETRLQKMNGERDEIIKKAEKEADNLLMEIRQQAEELRKKLAADAEAEAQEIIRMTREQLETERKAMIESLQEELIELICNTSETLVGTAFVSDKEKELTRELVKRI